MSVNLHHSNDPVQYGINLSARRRAAACRNDTGKPEGAKAIANHSTPKYDQGVIRMTRKKPLLAVAGTSKVNGPVVVPVIDGPMFVHGEPGLSGAPTML